MKAGIAIFLLGIVIALTIGIVMAVAVNDSSKKYYDWCTSVNGQVVELYGADLCVTEDGRIIPDGR